MPDGWDDNRVQKVLQHYENQTPDEAVAEDEADIAAPKRHERRMRPVSKVRKLIAKHQN